MIQDNKEEHLDSHVGRIREFQNQLIGWGITWNIALVGASFLNVDSPLACLIPTISLLSAFVLNWFLGKIYLNESRKNREITNTPASKSVTLKNLKIIWWYVQSVIVSLLIVNAYIIVSK